MPSYVKGSLCSLSGIGFKGNRPGLPDFRLTVPSCPADEFLAIFVSHRNCHGTGRHDFHC